VLGSAGLGVQCRAAVQAPQVRRPKCLANGLKVEPSCLRGLVWVALVSYAYMLSSYLPDHALC
jgi:hypothetical protein